MIRPIVLVYEPYDRSGRSLSWLEDQGVEVRRGPGIWEKPPRRMAEGDLIAAADGCIGLMGGGASRISQVVIDSVPDLRYISKYGIGVDNIDLEAAKTRGIIVANSPIDEVYEPVCEHAITLMLAVLKRLPRYTPAHLAHGGWRDADVMLRSVTGLTIGIIGYGRIGRGVARRLKGWGAEILVHDPFLTEADHPLVDLDDLLARSDVLSLHAPSTEENHHLIDSEAIARMRDGAIIVNTARGALIDEEALAEALRSGKLGGAGLDVFESEPMRNPKLLDSPNLVATPHVASWTDATLEAVAMAGARNMLDMIQGRTPESLVAYDQYR